jgi:hypothetical protein
VHAVNKYIGKVVNIGSEYDLKKFNQSTDAERKEIMMAFFGSYIRKIMLENHTEHDGISVESFELDSLKFEVSQALGRTDTNKKARCFAVVQISDFDDRTNRVYVKFRVMEPVKAMSSNVNEDLDPGEFTPELQERTDRFIEWLNDTAELVEFKATDPGCLERDELQILELFYTILQRFGKVKVSTETVMCLARMYPRILYRFPSFKEASVYKKAEVMHSIARRSVSGDPHKNAKEAFYALYDAGMVDRFMYCPEYYGSHTTYTLRNKEEVRGDRYPVGLRNEDERKRGWYLIKDDLLWIMFEYTVRSGAKLRVCLKPFDMWHTLAWGDGNDSIQDAI